MRAGIVRLIDFAIKATCLPTNMHQSQSQQLNDRMKFFLAILSIAMMAQASMGGSLGRVKRADEVEQAFIDLLKLSGDLIDLSITVSSSIVEAIPENEEYAKLKVDLKEYLDVAQDLGNKSENCIAKTGKALEALFKLLDKYDDGEEDSSAETKAFEDMLEKFGGDKLKKSAKDFYDKYFNESFFEKFSSYNEENAENWAILKENC